MRDVQRVLSMQGCPRDVTKANKLYEQCGGMGDPELAEGSGSWVLVAM